MSIEKIQLNMPDGYKYKPRASAAPRPDAVEIKNQAGKDVLWLTGEFGWDIALEGVRDAVVPYNIKGQTLNVNIDSYGGDVFTGFAIRNLFASLDCDVHIHVVSVAASIGQYVLTGADRVTMSENAFQMIHNPWAWMAGEADELETTASLLRKMKAQIAADLKSMRARVLGSDDGEDIEALMDATTWCNSQESAALGFCDEITAAVNLQNSVRAQADISPVEVPEEVIVEADPVAEPTEEEKAAAEALAAEQEAAAAAAAEAEAAALAAAEEAAAAEAARVEEEAALAATQAENEIRVVCRAFEAPDRAEEFINAKASIVDVKKALWKAAAQKDAEILTDPTPPAPEKDARDAYHNQADEIRAKYVAALRGK